jgi:hypothetical protein
MTETAKILHEIHGLSSLDRSGREGIDVSQEVLIRDRKGLIHIELGNLGYGAGLTPAAARYLARMLDEAANRIEFASKADGKDAP